MHLLVHPLVTSMSLVTVTLGRLLPLADLNNKQISRIKSSLFFESIFLGSLKVSTFQSRKPPLSGLPLRK